MKTTQLLSNAAYLVAGVLFILALRGLSSQETARRGNTYGIVGMLIAIGAIILVEHLRQQQIAYKDEARSYQLTPWPLRVSRNPFPHQRESVQVWWRNGGQGVVVLPTGTGKTFVAVLAIHHVGRPALVVTPTIDLMSQWYSELRLAFDVPVGLLGGVR